MILNVILDSTSLIIVGIFLLVTLIIGLYAGRNVKDFKDYVLGGKRFSTTTLVLTFLATNIGGYSVLGFTDAVIYNGIIVLVSFFAVFFRNLFFSLIAQKIILFKNCLTIGDIVEECYGKNYKIFIGILTFIYSLCCIILQLILLGELIHNLFGINQIYGIIITGLILGSYSAFGGIYSVSFTDVFQFLSLIIAIPLLGFLLLKKSGGLKEVILNIPNNKLFIFEHKNFIYYASCFVLWSIFPEKLLSPPLMQRMLMVKTKKQAKNMFRTAALFDLVFRILMTIIAFSILRIFTQVETKNVLLYSIKHLLPISLKGVIIFGILSVIMSTTDSFLNSTGVLVTNDIIKPIAKKLNIKFNLLLGAQLCTFLTAFIAIIFSLNASSPINVYNLSIKFTTPILLPIIAGIYGLKSKNKDFLVSYIVGLVSLFILNFFLEIKYKMIAVPISMLLGGINLILLHLIQNKGIAIINRDYDQNKPQRIWKPTWQGFLETLFSYIPTPHKIFEFSRKSVSRCGANNMLFGIFVCINFIVPYFMWDHKNEDLYNLMIYLRFFGGLLGGLLIVKTEWKDFLKPYFPLFWHFTLLYCLPFISTVMFLLTNGSIIWLLNIGTSIFFLIMLTENIVFLTLTPIGIVLGILFYILRVGPVDLSSFGFEVNYQLIYQVLFSSTIGLLFSYRKKIFNSIKGNEGTNLGLAMCHELRNTGLYIYPAAQISLMYLKKYKDNLNVLNKENGYFIKEQDFEYIKEQNQEIERLGRLQKNIVGTFEKLLKEYRDSINDPQNFSMKYIVNQAISQYIFKPGQKEKLDINLNKDFIAKIPKQVFIFVVDNIIRNSYKHGNPSKIKIWLEENELHIKDNGKGISEREMDLIFKMYFTNGDSSSSGIGLAFAKQIIEGFGGEIWVESQTGSSSYTEFIIKFPKVSEELSEEEIKENMELEIKKNIAKTMKEEGVEKKIIEKSIGISTDDLQDDE